MGIMNVVARAVFIMQKTLEVQVDIANRVSGIVEKFDASDVKNATPLVRELERQVKRSLENNREVINVGKEEKRRMNEAFKSGSPLGYSAPDIAGAFLVSQFSDALVFIDQILFATQVMLESHGHKEENVSVLTKCRDLLREQQLEALEEFHKVVIRWPWNTDTADILEAQDAFSEPEGEVDYDTFRSQLGLN